MGERPRVVIVDDEPLMLESMKDALGKKDYDVRTFTSGRSAVRAVEADGTDVLIADLKMPEMDGITLLKATKEVDPDVLVIVMTAYSTVATAVDAMKAGAYEYVQKPFDIDELDLVMRRGLGDRRSRRVSGYVARSQEAEVRSREIVGRSPEIAAMKELIHKAAASDCTVLVQGESGTGKELVARHVHGESPRRDELFVPVNAAAISESLLESELFGHAKGAFTGADAAHKGLFEAADGGTLFLDEISETSASVQAKLLRAIEEKEIRPLGTNRPIRVDVGLIASTNADLAQAVREGRFREDLFYRLNVFPITVPPLRERKEDILLLAEHFLRRAGRRRRKAIGSISATAMEVLTTYRWPGNVRELENVIERAVIVEEGSEITRASLFVSELPGAWSRGHEGRVPAYSAEAAPAAKAGSNGSYRSRAGAASGLWDDILGMPFHEAKNAFEKHYVETRLGRALRTGTMTELAEELGIHRTTLYELVRRHDIELSARQARRGSGQDSA